MFITMIPPSMTKMNSPSIMSRAINHKICIPPTDCFRIVKPWLPGNRRILHDKSCKNWNDMFAVILDCFLICLKKTSGICPRCMITEKIELSQKTNRVVITVFGAVLFWEDFWPDVIVFDGEGFQLLSQFLYKTSKTLQESNQTKTQWFLCHQQGATPASLFFIVGEVETSVLCFLSMTKKKRKKRIRKKNKKNKKNKKRELFLLLFSPCSHFVRDAGLSVGRKVVFCSRLKSPFQLLHQEHTAKEPDRSAFSFFSPPSLPQNKQKQH